MKNVHTKLMLLIAVLIAGSIWTVAAKKTRLGLDIKGGMRVVLRAKKEELPKGKVWATENLETLASILRKRVDSLGVAEPIIYTRPDADQIIVELPGLTNKEQARESVQTTAKLEFRYVKELEGTWRVEDEKIDGKDTGYQKILGADGKPVSVEELNDKVFSNEQTLVVGGEELLPNSYAELRNDGMAIHFEFQGKSAQIFEDFTRSHIDKPLAVFLDKKLISAPNINSVIPGKGEISGNFTPDQAKTLASQLNAGALPVGLEWMSDYSVEATLGEQAVKQTLLAGIVGLVVVLIFMVVYYRGPGLLADLALVLYTLFTFALFKLIPVTLTVPGIAGFILSIGMAVDANILIFERMKEERASGKSLRASIEAGFKRAFTAIFDSNVCTLITCAILYQYGTGPVRGFALTLAVGVAVSMFTAITCSRSFLLLFAGTKMGQNERIYPHGRGLHPTLNVTKRMAFWFAVSGLIVVPGLIAIGAGGIKTSIEFTGGTEVGLVFQQKPSVADITSVLQANGHEESRVLLAQDNRAIVTTKRMSPEQQTALAAAFTARGGRVEASQTVSAAISRELTMNAFLAVIYASVIIVLYLAIRFSVPNFKEGLKFGICAVAALLHDVLVLLGVFAIFGYFMNWQIDSLFVTAMLTVIGFSVHDTIIIFDRIRENLKLKAKGETFAEVTDRSIEQTFARSINTSGTVVVTLLALLIFGGPVIKLFVTALLIGIVSGTYSSIFNASPLLVLWKRRSGDKAMPAPAGPTAGSARAIPRAFEPATRPRPSAAPVRAAAKPAIPVEHLPSADGDKDAGTSVKSKKRKRRL